MSTLETRTFRADTLEEALGAVRTQLGPDAIVVRQREGIVGGIGGFFGKRCYEVEAEPPLPVPAAPRRTAVPARAITSAYTGPETSALELEPDHVDDLFGSLLDETSVFASTLADAIEREPEPKPELEQHVPELEPPFQPIAVEELAPGPPLPAVVDAPGAVDAPEAEWVEQQVTIALTLAMLDPRLAESIVADAASQLRAFDSTEPFANQVRETLAQRIPTRRLNERERGRVIALVGPPRGGKTTNAARLCKVLAACDRRVAAVSVEPLRQALELVRLTEGLDVELLAADQPGLTEHAAQRFGLADTVVVDTPGIAAGDDAGWTTLATLLRPLEVNETHLVLPAGLRTSDIDALLCAASLALRVDRILLTHLDGGPNLGTAVAAAIRARVPISATATAERLVPADSYRLAAAILP